MPLAESFASYSCTDDALAELGVTDRTLSDAQRSFLDINGYLVLARVLDDAWVKEACDVYEDLMLREGQSAGREFAQETGTRRLADLVNKHPVFDRVYIVPEVLAAVRQVLKRDFKFSNLNGRDAIPGQGHQPLHSDVPQWPSRNGQLNAVTCVVMLDAFTELNGATRVVPGTHRTGVNPQDWRTEDGDPDPHAPHPNEVILTGPAGSVAVMVSHLWHGGTANRTHNTRRALHPFYVGRELPQHQVNQREYIRVATYNRISPAARYLMDVE